MVCLVKNYSYHNPRLVLNDEDQLLLGFPAYQPYLVCPALVVMLLNSKESKIVVPMMT